MSDLMTVREAAREANVTNQYIINLIKEGTIAASKLGYQYAVDRASFDAWLAKRRQKQAPEAEGGEEAEAEGARA